jgi:TP901 family phage tail tape measure protein
MADYKVSVDVDVNSSELDKLEAKVSRIKLETPEVGVKVNTEDFKKINKIIKEVDNKGVTVKATVEGVNKLGELQTQIYSLNKKGETDIKTRVVTEDVDKAKADIQKISEAYKKMTSEINKIASMKAELVGLDKSSKRAKDLTNDIAESTGKVKALKSEIKSLNDGSMPTDMARGYKEAWANVSKGIRDAKSSISDKSDVSNIKANYKEVLDITREIGKKKIALVGLKESSEDAKYLTHRLKELEKAKNAINTSKFTDAQNKAIKKLESKNSDNLAQAQAKFSDKAIAQAQKNAISEIEGKYKELLNTTRKIGKTKIQLLGLEEASSEAKSLNQRLKELEDRKAELASTRYNLFNDAQEKSIASAEKDNAYALEKAESKLSDLKTKAAKDIVVKFDVQGNLDSQMSNVDAKLASLGKFADRASNEYNELTASAKRFQSALSGGNESEIIATSAQFNSSLDKMKNKLTEVTNEKKKFDAEMKSVSGALGAAETSGDVTHKLESQIKSFVEKPKAAISALKELKAAQQELNASASRYKIDSNAQNKSALIASEKRFASAVKESNVQIEKQNLEFKKRQAALRLQKWGKEHDAFEQTPTHAKEFQQYIQAIASADTKAALDSAVQQTGVWTQRMELAGEAGQTMGTKIKNSFSGLMSYFSAASVILSAMRFGREAFQNVVDIDTRMTELKRVTDLSAEQYSSVYDRLSVSAQKYGVQLTDLISATADWSRAGFDANTASGLAEITSVYQHISDLDYDTASENLLTAYKGFQGELSSVYGNSQQGVLDAVNHIADVYNEIDNNYATTAADVGEAVKRSASALSVAGNSLEETAGMVTGITEVTQDPEKAGNALKVVSMRLRGMKGELQELGEEVDGNVTNISKMQGQVLNLTRGKVNIFDDAGNFKSTYEILQGVAGVWKELSSVDQATLLETMAGKHRANDLAAILGNWERVEAATKSAHNSTGSAMEEQAKYADSLQGRLNSLQAMWQQLSTTFINSDVAKTAVSAFKDLLNVINSIVRTIGGFGTAGLLGVLFAGFKKRSGLSNLVSGFFSDLNAGLDSGMSKMQAFGKAGKSAGSNLWSSLKTPAGALTAIAGVTTLISGVVTAVNSLHEAKIKALDEKIDFNNNFGSAFSNFEQAYIKYSGKAILSTEEENDFASAVNGTISALGEKSSALQQAAGASSEYFNNINKIATEEIKAQKRSATAAKNAAKDKLSDNLYWKETASFLFPDENSDQFKAVEDILRDKNFQKKYAAEIKDKNGKDVAYSFDMKADGNIDEMIEQYNYLKNLVQETEDYASKLSEDASNNLLNGNTYKDMKRTAKDMSKDIQSMIKATYDEQKAIYQLNNGIPKTTSDFYKMQNAVLSASSKSLETRMEISNLLNKDYGNAFDLSSAESQLKQFRALTSGIESISKDKENKFETLIEMKTQLNDGDCTVGEYTKAVDNANDAINKIAKTDGATANALRVQLGLEVDDDGNIDDEVVKLKNKFVGSLTKNKVDKDVAEKFTNSLSKGELEAAVELSANGEINLKKLDTKNLDKSIKNQIQDYAKYKEAMHFTIDVDAEAEGFEKLNSAMAEARTGTGLTQESMQALIDRYKPLDNYDAARLFEETANGISVNAKAVNEYESALADTKLKETDKTIDSLQDRYENLTNKIKDCSDASQKAKWINEREDIRRQISDLAELATSYKGLTSSYAEWQRAESAGNDRDMYQNVYSAQEGIKKELDNGWIDDGTEEYFKLIWGKDRWNGAGKSVQDYRDQWAQLDSTIQGTSYSISDFFTVNQDGELTSEGIFNFFDAVGQKQKELGKDWIQYDENGDMKSFNFGIDGDKAVADAMGVSEELVQIFMRASQDAGFVVDFNGTYTQFADMQKEAKAAQATLNDLFKTQYAFNFDTSSLTEARQSLGDAKREFAEKGIFDIDEKGNVTAFHETKKGAQEALQVVSTLQSNVDRLNQHYIGLTVEDDSFKEPLKQLQDYESKAATLNQLKLQPQVYASQIKELEGDLDNIVNYFNGLSKEQKVKFGIDGLTPDEIESRISSGEVTIPTTLDIQTQMSGDLSTLKDIALLNSGLLTKDQEDAIKKKVKIEWEAENDTSKAEESEKDAENKLSGESKGKKKKAKKDSGEDSKEDKKSKKSTDGSDKKEKKVSPPEIDTSKLQQDTQKAYDAAMANLNLKKSGKTKIDFDFQSTNIKDLNSQISEAQSLMNTFKNSDGSVDLTVDDAADAQTVLSALIEQKQSLTQPAIMDINISTIGDETLRSAIGDMQQLHTLSNEREVKVAIGADTSDVDSKIQTVTARLQSLINENPDVAAKLNLNTEDFQNALNSIQGTDIEAGAKLDPNAIATIQNALSGISPEILAKVLAGDTSDLDNLTGKATIDAKPSNTDLGKDFTGTGQVSVTPLSTALGGDFTGTGTATITPATTFLGADFTGTGQVTATPVNTDFGNVFSGTGIANFTPASTYLGANFSGDGKADIRPVSTYLGGDFTGSGRADMSASSKFLGSDFTGTGVVTVTVNKVIGAVKDLIGGGSVNGTAHVNGTAGSAFAQGNWGTKENGSALMGELGQEIIVRDGHWFTVGDNGAEFVGYKKGDIVFNHKQSEELLKNGYVTSGGGRGKALAEGTAFSRGTGSSRPTYGSSHSTSGNAGGGARPSGSKSSGSRSSGSNSNANKEAEKSEQTLDWIEVALNRVERAISRLDKTATSTFKNWTKRGTALNDQINQTRREIDLQNQAYNRYIQQANSVGLDGGYAAKVRDGTIDIEKITDDDLNKKISEYQQWYEKALDCLDAIDDLRESESQLYEQRFENVSTKYDGYLGVIQHEKDMLDEFVSQTETAGYITSGKYYDAMSANAKKQQEELKKQRDEMVAELNNAVNSGAIEKYSQSWYSMLNSIDDVTKSIEECNTSLLEYQKNLRELDWQIFDLVQDKISKVADESEFLINLMSNKKLYEDNGQLTNEGMASIGQYGVKYNVYMAQADKYAKKIKELQADLAKDPYNQDIANQLQEYIEAQQEAILNAEDMKNSIKDMVSEGIDKELDSLQKLIDKRNDALDAAKD